MANVFKKVKQKSSESAQEELIKSDAEALALLIYDIYQNKKRMEKNDDPS